MNRKSRLLKYLVILLATLMMTQSAVQGDKLPWYQQSPTATGSLGAVSTEHPLSSQAAIDILNLGGNAVEAAIAA